MVFNSKELKINMEIEKDFLGKNTIDSTSAP